MAQPSGEPGWAWRRAALLGIIVLSFVLLWVIIGKPDNRVNESVAWGLITLIFGAGMIYAGFATVQDVVAIIVTKSGLPYSPKSSPAEPTPNTPAPAAEVKEE